MFEATWRYAFNRISLKRAPNTNNNSIQPETLPESCLGTDQGCLISLDCNLYIIDANDISNFRGLINLCTVSTFKQITKIN